MPRGHLPHLKLPSSCGADDSRFLAVLWTHSFLCKVLGAITVFSGIQGLVGCDYFCLNICAFKELVVITCVHGCRLFQYHVVLLPGQRIWQLLNFLCLVGQKSDLLHPFISGAWALDCKESNRSGYSQAYFHWLNMKFHPSSPLFSSDKANLVDLGWKIKLITIREWNPTSAFFC